MSKPSQTSDKAAKNYGRPLSIEEASNRFFIHPLSGLIVRIALVLKISANAVSVLGLACGLLAAWFYAHQHHLAAIASGFALMLGWHVLDGADGKIARATGTASAFGRIIDGICDHLVFGAVYIAICIYLTGQGASVWIWGLAVLAAICHAVQAAGYEERRQQFQRRTRGSERADIASGLLEVGGKKSALASMYDRAQTFAAGGAGPLDEKLGALRARSEDTQSVVNQTAPIVRAWAILNANNRTFAIFITALMGQPEWYFWWEVAGLSIIMAGLIIWQRRFESGLAATL